MATSSPTTADVKNAVADQLKLLLLAKLGDDGYAEYTRLMDTLAGIERAEGIFHRGMYEPGVAAPTPVPPAVAPSQNGHVKTYGGTPTARERIRAYLKEHGPNRVVDILRGTGVKRGTISGILLGRDFVKVKHGVWNLRPGK